MLRCVPKRRGCNCALIPVLVRHTEVIHAKHGSQVPLGGFPYRGRLSSPLTASLTLAAMSLGYGVVQLDVTIVNTALSSIGNSLGGGVSELQWVVSAYTIAFAAFILTAGALGDRIGAKRVFMAGFAIFTAASLACALAPDAWILIAARAVQGLGAAILVPEFAGAAQSRLSRRQVARPRGRHLGRRREPRPDRRSAGRRRPDRAGRLALRSSWSTCRSALLGLWLTWRYAAETTRSPQREIDLPGQIAAIAALGVSGRRHHRGRRDRLAQSVRDRGLRRGGCACGAVRAAGAPRAATDAAAVAVRQSYVRGRPRWSGLLVNVAFYGLIFVLQPLLPADQRLVAVRDRSRLPADDGRGAADQSSGAASGGAHRRAATIALAFVHRRLRHASRLLVAAPGTSYWAIGLQLVALGGGLGLLVPPLDLDPARQRGEVALRHRRRRAQFDAADRQRAGRRPVRLADRAGQRVHGGDACFAGDLGWRSARGRGGDLVWPGETADG